MLKLREEAMKLAQDLFYSMTIMVGKGTFMKSVCFFLSTILLSFSLLSQAQQVEKPLFLSYEKRLVLTYLLAGAGESEEKQKELAARFEETLVRYLKMPVQYVTVRNFQEFLKVYQGPWPESYSVESDLNLIEERGMLRGMVQYRTRTKDGQPNPQLESQISGFIRAQNKELLQKSGLKNAPVAALLPMVDTILDPSNRFQFQSLVVKGFSKTKNILDHQMNALNNIGEQIATSGKLSELEPMKRLYIETLLKLYSDRLSLRSKKQIISSFLGENLNAGTMRKFEILVMNADPIFQKALQIIAGGAGIPKDLNETFTRLQSDVKPIPKILAQDIINAEKDKYGIESVNYDKPKGGTIAQVYFGTMATENRKEDIVVRFIRPEIEKRIEEGGRILTEIATLLDNDPRFKDAGFPKIAPLVPDVIQSVVEELNMEQTIAQQKIGQKIYNREVLLTSPEYKTMLDVYVPEVVDRGRGSRLMVQEKVSGNGVEAEVLPYEKAAPNLKKAIMEKLAQIWTEEALFRSGFFHADLHPGNFLIEVTDPAVHLNIIDFGMAGVISKETQTHLILLVAGLELNKAEIVSEAMLSLSVKNENRVSPEVFLQRVKERMEMIRSGKVPKDDFQKWVAWAMTEGIRFPYDFVNLNRGVVTIETHLQKVKSSLSVKEIARRLAIQNARSVFFRLKEKGVLTLKDMMALGLMAVTPQSSGGGKSCNKVHGSAKRISILDSSIATALGI